MRNAKQVAEAIERMEIIGLNQDVIEKFKKNEIVQFARRDSMNSEDVDLFTSDDFLGIPEKVRKFENSQNATVYYITSEGQFVDFFYVSNYSDDWEIDRNVLKQQYTFARVNNLANPIFDETGSIWFKNVNGALIRTQ